MNIIKLTNGGEARVDNHDWGRLNIWSWFRVDKGHTSYAMRTDDHTFMHNVIMYPGENLEVDHIDGDGLNNQRINLRYATRSQQLMNKGLQINNTSGYPGVHFFKRKRRWTAYINKKGKRKNLGYFLLYEDAVKARKKAEKELFGDFACNNPERTML